MKYALISVDDIEVGDRYREDYGDLESLAESIKENGLIQPITVDKNKKLMAGGRRLAACRIAGLEKVPCMVNNTDSDVDHLVVELIENINRLDFHYSERCRLEKDLYKLMASTNSKWTVQDHASMLGVAYGTAHRNLELAAAIEIIPNLAKQVNAHTAWKEWKKVEQDLAAHQLRKKLEDSLPPDQVEVQGEEKHHHSGTSPANREPQETSTNPEEREYQKSRSNNAFTTMAIQNYRIGDALDGMARCKKESVYCLELDPPYGIDLDKRREGRQAGKMDRYEEISREEYPQFLDAIISSAYRCMRKDSFGIIWFGMDWYSTIYNLLLDKGLSVSPIPCVWVKDGSSQTAAPDYSLGSGYESFFLFRKGTPKLAKTGRSNVFTYKRVPPSQKIHETQKPVELMEDILTTVCYPGLWVFSPFLGSGVTIRAAYRSGMRAWGYELSESLKNRFLVGIHEDEEAGLLK